jgi:hypothetical protein
MRKNTTIELLRMTFFLELKNAREDDLSKPVIFVHLVDEKYEKINRIVFIIPTPLTDAKISFH